MWLLNNKEKVGETKLRAGQFSSTPQSYYIKMWISTLALSTFWTFKINKYSRRINENLRQVYWDLPTN